MKEKTTWNELDVKKKTMRIFDYDSPDTSSTSFTKIRWWQKH